MKKFLYKIPGLKWADAFTDRPLGAVLGLLLGVDLWLGVLAVVHYELDQRPKHPNTQTPKHPR